MSEERKVGDFISRHRNAGIIAGVGLAATAAALLAARALQKRRPRDDEAQLSDVGRADMHARLDVFRDPRVSPRAHGLLLATAARIYLATHHSEGHIALLDVLYEQIDADETALDLALTRLEDAKLIGVRLSSVDPQEVGYFAEAPLSWAAGDDDDNSLPELQQAISTILNKGTS